AIPRDWWQQPGVIAVVGSLLLEILANRINPYLAHTSREIPARPEWRLRGKSQVPLTRCVRLYCLDCLRDTLIGTEAYQTAKVTRVWLALQEVIIMLLAYLSDQFL